MLCIDHTAGFHAALDGAIATYVLPVELSGRVRVTVNRKHAAHLDCCAQQFARRIFSLRPAVDFENRSCVQAGLEYRFVIKGRRWPFARAGNHAAGAVSENVDIGIFYCLDHSFRHGLGIHAQFGMHARDHNIQLRENFGQLVDSPVFEDVDFDACENLKCRLTVVVVVGEEVVYVCHFVDLFDETFGGESVRDSQSRRVICKDHVFVTKRASRARHFENRAASVGPCRMRVTIAP